MKKDANTVRMLAVVRFGHRLPARPLQTRPQTGPITIHCAAKLSVQCNYTKCLALKILLPIFLAFWKISATNLRILWRHLPSYQQNYETFRAL